MTDVESWQAAEAFTAAYLKAGGHADARTTVSGADGGVDVRGAAVLAQVKFHITAVGRPDVQRLFGARGRGSEELYFFSLNGFSPHALQYAKEHGIGLLSYTSEGAVTAHTSLGRRLAASVTRRAAEAHRDKELAAVKEAVASRTAESRRELAEKARAQMGPGGSFIYGTMRILAGLGMLLLAFALFAENEFGLASAGVGSLTCAGGCFIYLWFAGGVIEVPDDWFQK